MASRKTGVCIFEGLITESTLLKDIFWGLLMFRRYHSNYGRDMTITIENCRIGAHLNLLLIQRGAVIFPSF